MAPLSIPSPGWSAFHLGPVTIHAYALCILTGIVLGWIWAQRRFVAKGGGDQEDFESILGISVVAGIIGARVYHVVTDHQLYFGPGRHPVEALYIWNGGLGIWGAVAFGALAAWWQCRRRGVRFDVLADATAPAVLLAQAVGRLGNWFNQELFGRPTTLPWALRIDPQHRPAGYLQYATFHPTFLYEIVWNLAGVGFLLWAERRFHVRGGRLFWLYVATYCLGRVWIERLRIDAAHVVGGFRLNEYTSVIVFAAAVVAFWVMGRRQRTTASQGQQRSRD